MRDNVQMTRMSTRPWFGPLMGLVTFVVVLVGAGALAGVSDWAIRNAEMSDLLSRVEVSEAAMSAVQDDIARITVEYEQLPAPDDADKAALTSQLQEAAAEGRDAVAQAGQGVAALPILPWHSQLRQAQDDYLAHNVAWQEHLDRAATDPTEFMQPQELINSTFEQAEVSMRAALPAPAVSGLLDRVGRIFAPVPMEGQQAA